MAEKYVTLRLTMKVDLDDKKETSFARAMLRRLNVLYAKCRPKGGLAKLLNGSHLSDAYDGKQTIGGKVDKVDKVVKHDTRKVVTFRGFNEPEKVLPATIAEQSMEPPAIVQEISGG